VSSLRLFFVLAEAGERDDERVSRVHLEESALLPWWCVRSTKHQRAASLSDWRGIRPDCLRLIPPRGLYDPGGSATQVGRRH
jgi:hypothetical protein